MKPLTDEQREIVEQNLGLVMYIVDKMKGDDWQRSDVDDYIQIGNIGLIKAASVFDPGKGIKFATYAYHCITNEIFMNMRRGRQQSRNASVFSLDLMCDDFGGSPLVELIPSYPDEGLSYIYYKDLLSYLFDRSELNTLQMNVLRLRMSEMTQTEIAEMLGCSQSYISRILKAIQRKVYAFYDDGSNRQAS